MSSSQPIINLHTTLQFKINDRGIAALAYNVLLREGVTLGVGGSFDTQKLDQATHKVRILPRGLISPLPSASVC